MTWRARVSSRGRMDWNMQRMYFASCWLSKFSSANISLMMRRIVPYTTALHISINYLVSPGNKEH